MGDVRHVNIPYSAVLELLAKDGSRYTQSPISWHQITEYLADMPDFTKGNPVVAMEREGDTIGIWPWEEGGAVVRNPPLAVLRKDTPTVGLGVGDATKVVDYVPKSGQFLDHGLSQLLPITKQAPTTLSPAQQTLIALNTTDGPKR